MKYFFKKATAIEARVSAIRDIEEFATQNIKNLSLNPKQAAINQ